MTEVDEVRVVGVRFERVVKTFGATAALRGVSGRLEPGVTIIEGANGSGKSTLLKIIGTIMRPSSGRVSYAPIGDELASVRACIGWVSHESLCYGDLSGRQNVELAASFHGVDVAARWPELAERFELGRFAERPFATSSRGQRQRIALARALAHRPSLILLDEPTTGLDVAGVARLERIVREEVEAGAVVAVVTHESQAFAELATQRIKLARGNVVDAA